MEEKRRQDRIKLMTFTAVYDLEKGSLLGYLGDLTQQGAMLVASKPLKVNQRLVLEIAFHGTPEAPASRMTLSARVAWCGSEPRTVFFKIGLEFLDPTEQNKQVIAAVLKRYQFSPDVTD